jgi:hypothetical protein
VVVDVDDLPQRPKWKQVSTLSKSSRENSIDAIPFNSSQNDSYMILGNSSSSLAFPRRENEVTQDEQGPVFFLKCESVSPVEWCSLVMNGVLVWWCGL